MGGEKRRGERRREGRGEEKEGRMERGGEKGVGAEERPGGRNERIVDQYWDRGSKGWFRVQYRVHM